MQKVIVIGDCALDVIFPPASSQSWPLTLSGRPAGRLFNAAALLGKAGRGVTFVGEAGRDAVGTMLTGYLSAHGVDTHCLDRFSSGGGVTPSNFIVSGSDEIITNRNFTGDEGFCATWPRIDADDIVVFGGYFAISDRTRSQVMELVNYASERHATLVYLPGFVHSLVPRITRVMPAILENLEVADVVLASSADLRYIFGRESGSDAFARNIRFYCPTMLLIDTDTDAVELFHGDRRASAALGCSKATLEAQAAGVAAFVEAMLSRGMTRADLASLSQAQMGDMSVAVASAVQSSTDTAAL